MIPDLKWENIQGMDYDFVCALNTSLILYYASTEPSIVFDRLTL
jgi:hypothetical protein